MGKKLVGTFCLFVPDKIIFTAGAGIKAALEKELGISLYVPPEQQITRALGAALYNID
ncbi:MAG TPA: hypothetical protein VGK06_05870 [Methanosarcina sp.]